MKTLDRVMVCLFFAVAILPVAAMKLRLHDHVVFGSLPPTPRPELSFDGFADEAYQHAFTAWFESELGWKGYSVTTDNALLYHVFRDTKSGSQVMLGDGGVLFKDEDLAYYNKHGADLPDQARVDALADKIAALQARLAAQHRALVPMIIPSKTTIYRDKVPAAWSRDLGQPRPSDERVYRAFVKALDARKVAYVDSRAQFVSGEIPRELLWGTGARHWTYYGACLAMKGAADRYRELTGKPLPPYDCTLKKSWVVPSHDDYDLLRLLNTWWAPRRSRTVALADHGWPPPDEPRPSVMIVGTSFCWGLLRDADGSHLFGKLHMDYYNRTLVEWPANIHTKVVPYSPEWRAVFLDKDLYVLDLLEVYLLAPDTYVDEFLAELGAELPEAVPANEPTTGATIGEVRDLGVTDGKHYFELWGAFPDPGKPYTATITCNGKRRAGSVYYQNPNGQQLNVHVIDPGPGTCDRTQSPPRASGVSCTFHVTQGAAIGSQIVGPRQVCPGPQGSSGQEPDGRCLAGLLGSAGC